MTFNKSLFLLSHLLFFDLDHNFFKTATTSKTIGHYGGWFRSYIPKGPPPPLYSSMILNSSVTGREEGTSGAYFLDSKIKCFTPFVMGKTKPHHRTEYHSWELWEQLCREPYWSRDSISGVQILPSGACSLPSSPSPISLASREPGREGINLHAAAAVPSWPGFSL